MNRFVICLLLLTVSLVSGLFHEKHEDLYDSSIKLPADQVQKWFEHQRLDHFDPASNSTWRQRYWIIHDYYKPDNGAVFLYICGEYTCSGIPSRRQFPITLAKKYNALILVLEHRFYGQSQPFGKANWTTERLSYLSADQALEDLAYFIKYVKDNAEFRVGPQNKWITMGGSYPGALSAWFRAKYPHLTVGALASSAVINAIEDFWYYDDQVFNSFSRSGSCASDAQAISRKLESILNQGKAEAEALKKSWGLDNLTNELFMEMVNDVFAGNVQVGTRVAFCSELAKYKSLDDKIEHLRQGVLAGGPPNDYTVEQIRNETVDENRYGRQWWWQVCTEFGWLYTTSKVPGHEIASKSLSVDFYKQFCKDIFGNFATPDIPRTNNRFGGLDTRATNIIFTNGWEDGWRWASLLKNYKDATSIVIDCDDCSHCVDLSTPKSSDSFSLKLARWRITYAFWKWLKL